MKAEICNANLYLFIATALLGFYLFRNDLFKRKAGPMVVVVAHALCAAVAITLLILFCLLRLVFSRQQVSAVWV